MPVAVTSGSRRKYAEALRNIDEALVLVAEALRDDAEADARALKVVIEELSDAAERIRRRLGKEVG